MKTITLRIRRDGTVEAETHGMNGRECLPYIGKLEQLVEADAVDSEYTAEYYHTAQAADEGVIHEQQVDQS